MAAFVRFLADGLERYGRLEGQRVMALEGDPFFGYRPDGDEYSWAEVAVLAPCRPSKVICVAGNYSTDPAAAQTDAPLFCIRPGTAVIGPDGAVVHPAITERLEMRGELAVVIGRTGRLLNPEEAADIILGYTAAISLTAADLGGLDAGWTRAVAFDTFCSLGPVISNGVAAHDLTVEVVLNDIRMQRYSTSGMRWGPAELVSHVSRVMTLLPRDVILCGAPAALGPVVPADRVRVAIEGIGELENPVVAEAL